MCNNHTGSRSCNGNKDSQCLYGECLFDDSNYHCDGTGVACNKKSGCSRIPCVPAENLVGQCRLDGKACNESSDCEAPVSYDAAGLSGCVRAWKSCIQAKSVNKFEDLYDATAWTFDIYRIFAVTLVDGIACPFVEGIYCFGLSDDVPDDSCVEDELTGLKHCRSTYEECTHNADCGNQVVPNLVDANPLNDYCPLISQEYCVNGTCGGSTGGPCTSNSQCTNITAKFDSPGLVCDKIALCCLMGDDVEQGTFSQVPFFPTRIIAFPGAGFLSFVAFPMKFVLDITILVVDFFKSLLKPLVSFFEQLAKIFSTNPFTCPGAYNKDGEICDPLVQEDTGFIAADDDDDGPGCSFFSAGCQSCDDDDCEVVIGSPS